jgi:tocopherol O-methyltransferase
MKTTHKQSIVKYYDATWLDYRVLWFGKKNRSVHFGFYNDDITNHDDALLNMNREMARRAGIRDGDVVLDAGCGQGGSSLWLAENFNVDVTGITLVPHQVKKALQLSQKSPHSARLSFHLKDYTNTGLEAESFDVVWACESLCHAEDKLDFYKEAFRLLKPGGRLIVAEYIRNERPLTESGEMLLHEWLSGWSIKDIDTKAEHQKNIESCGFTNFYFEDVTKNTEASLKRLYELSIKFWKSGVFMKKIGLRNTVNHGNHYSAIKQYEALQDNLWHYGLFTAQKTQA